MKNILILSPDAPENCMGGLGTHIRNVLKRVDTATFNVVALCQGAENITYQDGKVKVFGVDTTPVMGLPANGLTDTFFMQTRFVARFMELYQAGTIAKPDLIHICDWTTAVAGEEIARSTGAKPVFAVHLSINNYIKEVHPLFKINCETAQQIEFNACRISHRVLQVTKAYSELFPFNFYKHKTVVCPNGVDYEAYGNAEARTHHRNEESAPALEHKHSRKRGLGFHGRSTGQQSAAYKGFGICRGQEPASALHRLQERSGENKHNGSRRLDGDAVGS